MVLPSVVRHQPLVPSATALIVTVLMLAAITLSGSARAQDTLFIVDGVKVDKTADNSEVARDEAIAQGRMKAWAELVQRVLPQGQQNAVPKLKYREVRALIREYSIVEEKASAVRYIATLRFRFDETKVRDLLEQYGMAPVEAPATGTTVLVLAVGVVDGKPVLWEDQNDWRQTWERYRRRGGFVQLVTPLGDLADIQALSLEQALKVENEAMNRISGRYNAGAVVLVGLAREDGGDYKVAVKPWVLGQTIEPFRITVKKEEAGNGLMGVVEATARAIDGKWKQATTTTSANAAPLDLSATVMVGSLAEWVEIKERLESIPMLSKVERVSMTPGEARVNLVMHGELAQFEMALDQLGLVLNQGFGDLTISRRDGGLAAPVSQEQPGGLTTPTDQGGLAPLPVNPLPPANGQTPIGQMERPVDNTAPVPTQQAPVPPMPEPRKSIGGMQVEELPPVGN